VKVAREKGPEVRMSFFRHPNAPSIVGENKQGEFYTKHLSVDEVTGLFGNMAGLFYSQAAGEGQGYRMAPLLGQLYDVKHLDDTLKTDLICFGFHMLSSKQNIHGGYEFEQFEYPLLGGEGRDDEEVLIEAQGILSGAAEQAVKIQSLLCRVAQLCMMVQVDSKDNEGRMAFTYKQNVNDGGFVLDLGREFWGRLGGDVRELLKKIGDHGDSVDALQNVRSDLGDWWLERIANHAKALFEPIFNDYSASPQNFLAAHNARRIFYGGLRNMGVRFGSSSAESETATGADAGTEGTHQPMEAS